ncbi:MAG: ABC transporter substrate-binding protein [Spirochaetaceae bacterium]|jgi:peptide/nickel transport system substrate-binding protein|nr:ABC transporter substrate-binding protein [Spirochaetaceae bacterium]
MTKKITLITVVIALGVAAALFAGGSKDRGAVPAESSAITYGIPTQPDHLDPYEATSADSRFILFNLFEGLFKPAPDGRLIPAVAASYSSSADFLTWTIKLKDSVYFHNGNRVTAADVVYSLNRAAEKKLYGLQSISGIETPDPSTVIIRLSEADPEFYYYLTNAVIPAGYEGQNTAPVGTGPFKFVSFTPQYELVLEKFGSYWQPDLPRAQKLVFKIKADYNSVMLDLKAGSLNAGTIDTTSVQQLDQSQFSIIYEKINMVQIFCLNNAYAPLRDPRVRQAISYAVDVDEIIALAHNGQAVRAATPVIPALSYAYNKDCEGSYPVNLEKARALMAEAGYAGGFTLEITQPSVYQPHIDTAQVIINQLAKIGIKGSIKLVDWPTWLSEVYTDRKYQGTVISIDGVTLSPRSFLFRYESKDPQNFMNYSNAEFDRLYAATLRTVSEAERIGAYKKMQEIVVRDAASVFICDLFAPRVFKKNITGFQGYPLSVFDASLLKVD